MRKFIWKNAVSFSLAAAMLVTCAVPAAAKAPADGWTNAQETVEAYGDGWTNWINKWNNTVSKDWTQISLSPGSDESELNFAWYSKVDASNTGAPKLKIGEGKKMKNAKTYTATQTEATTDRKDRNNLDNAQQYKSNKVTATGLKEDTTYYYSYQKDGKWTTPEEYTTGSEDSFSFIYVGDPQIGSSNEKKGEGSDPEVLEEFYPAQSDAVANDSFNWNTTLNQAVAKADGASFVVSAGDQIQTKLGDCPYEEGWGSEIEYAGYLSPDVLKNLPVATSVGNHDADNPNYTYHFNTANSSELGATAAGGDYWFTYDNALFIMLNTQNDDIEEHKQFIEQAVAANKDCKWRIVTMHQDIYGSAEHSNEPEIANLRYALAPIFEANDVDVVLTGHDHAYSRSMIMEGAVKKFGNYTDDEFDAMLDKDIDAGDNTQTVYTAYQNIKDNTTDPEERAYLNYLTSIMDADAVEAVQQSGDVVVNPEGILYMTASSSSGSKYYDLVSRKQTYVANRWQEDVPTYSVVKITDDTFTIDTYRTDTDEKIDSTFTIAKVDENQNSNQNTDQNSKPNDSQKTDNTQQPAAEAQKVDISGASVTGKTTRVYTGKEMQPAYTVTTADGKVLTEGQDYTITYSNNKKVGVATAVITGMGDYTGTKEVNFSILPKKAKIKKVTAKKSGAKVTFKKNKGGVTGYQVTYSLNKKFRTKRSENVKKTSAVLKKLRSGRTYYVKVRAFKKVNGTKIYGKYSAVQKVRVR